MKRIAQTPPRHSGFTLVELLVALSLAVVVTALILAAFLTLNTVQRGQIERAACLDTTRLLLRQVADDLERTFVFPKDKATTFKLVRGAAASNAVFELAFVRAAARPGEDDLRWADVDRLTYRLVEADRSNLTLCCLSQPLVGPGALLPAATNHLFQGLENFDVLLFDGKEWKDTWSVQEANATNAVPHAARLTITARHGGTSHTVTTEVMIPISMRFEPPKQEKGKNIRDIH